MSRQDRGFRFPLQKYSDEKALYTNFRYLQEYLNYIRRGDKRAPTILISDGTNSNHPDRADVVCDGTNDDESIQAAIDLLSGTEVHLHFLDGDYSLATALSTSGFNKTLVTGHGVIDCDGAFIDAGRDLIVRDLTFTGGATGVEYLDAGTDGLFIVEDCTFTGVTAKAIIRIGHGGGSREDFWVAIGNKFHDITISGGGGASPNGIFWGDDGGAGSRYGLIVGNFFDNVSGKISESNGGNSWLATGNTLRDSTGEREGIWFHNHVNGTYEPGDHSGLEHHDLGGLTDDDHTQYVLRTVLTTQGDIPFRNASDWTRLGIGTAGQALVVNSGATAPEWGDVETDPLSDVLMLGGM